MSLAAQVVAWGAVVCWALVVYSYALYPIVLAFLAAAQQLGADLKFLSNKADRRVASPTEWPAVAVVVAAYNEEVHIEGRVQNILSQDYPADKLTLYVGSDGSKDRTAEILRRIAHPRLRAHIVEANRGKASMLNDLREMVTEPIVVFSDANTDFHPQAVQRLVRWFADPRTGGVSGELRLRGNGGQNQDSLYWRMEQALKYFEGRLGALLGANGAIYAIRKPLWPALSSNTICDDFCIGMAVPAAQQRLVYDPSAWAEEDTPEHISEEYQRRLRIGVGNFQALFEHPEYLTRTSLLTRFTYVSHKVLRWLTPHLLLLALLLSAALATASQAWLGLTVAQLLAYAFLGLQYRRSKVGQPIARALRLPVFFFALNWAFLVASWRYAKGNHRGTWQRTAR